MLDWRSSSSYKFVQLFIYEFIISSIFLPTLIYDPLFFFHFYYYCPQLAQMKANFINWFMHIILWAMTQQLLMICMLVSAKMQVSSIRVWSRGTSWCAAIQFDLCWDSPPSNRPQKLPKTLVQLVLSSIWIPLWLVFSLTPFQWKCLA